MTPTLRPFRALAMAMTVALCATAAVRPSAAQPQERDHGTGTAVTTSRQGVAGMPGMSSDTMAQITALDTRIKMLATDMRMFSGELKVDVMASLLTAMIERQALMEGEMRTMREGTSLTLHLEMVC